MFTCSVTGWSEFDFATTYVCDGTTQGDLDHQIEYRVDYSPPGESRAIIRSYDLGAMFAEYVMNTLGWQVRLGASGL